MQYVICLATSNACSSDRFDERSAFWVHSVTGNYLSRWYKHTIGEVVALQSSLETAMFAQQATVEAEALRLLNGTTVSSRHHPALRLLGDFQEANAQAVLAESWSFFHCMVATYRDNVQIVKSYVDNYQDGLTIMTVGR